MANQGYILLYRSVMDNKDYFGHKFSTTEAWVDLLFLANHTDFRESKRGIYFTVKRGQVGYSMTKLAERWQWSKGKVKRFLNELENRTQIETQKVQGINHLTTVISITKYEQYQRYNKANDIADGTQTGRRRNADGSLTINESNESNESNKKKKKKKKNIGETKLIFPRCVERNLIEGYFSNRIEIKKPMTHRAKELFLKKVDRLHLKGENVKELIEVSIVRNYTDIYEKGGSNGKVNRASQRKPVEKAETKSGRQRTGPTKIEFID